MTAPHYRRFESRVLKNKSGSDSVQVPASATVDIYRQGATVTTATPVGTSGSVAVPVYDIGSLIANDVVLVDGGPTELTVSSITGTTTLNLLNNTVNPVQLQSGTRLTPKSLQPQFFGDALGTSVLGSSLSTDASTGRAAAYVRAKSYDSIVNGTGLATRVYPDAEGAFVTSLTGWLNAGQFASIQAAIDALPPDGGTVFIPAGTHILTAGITISNGNITLIGEGGATVIQPAVPDQYDLITVNNALFHLSNLVLDAKATHQSTTGHTALSMNGPDSGNLVLSCLISGVVIRNAARAGCKLTDTIASAFINCDFVDNWGDGIQFFGISSGLVSIQLIGCRVSNNYGRGLTALNLAVVAIIACTFLNNSLDGSTGTQSTTGSALDIRNVNCVAIEGGMVGPPGASAANLLYVDGISGPFTMTGIQLDGGYVQGAAHWAQRGLVAGTVSGGSAENITLLGCAWSNFSTSTSPVGAVALIAANYCNSLAQIVSSQQEIAVSGIKAIVQRRGALIERYEAAALPPASLVEPGTLAMVHESNAWSIYVASAGAWRMLQAL